METKVCEICKEEKSVRGFNLHEKWCREKKVAIRKEKPVILPRDLPFALVTESIREEIQHKPDPVVEETIECPYCHCTDTTMKLYYMEPCQSYRCNMCGHAYQYNVFSKEYIYER